MKFRAERKIFTDAITLYLQITPGQYGSAIEIKTYEPGECVKPLIDIDHTAAQGLMDELWHVGLRPSEGSGSAGALAATERHLKDMQRIVFKGK